MITPPRGLLIWHVEQIRPDYFAALKKQNCKMVYLKTLDDASSGIFWPQQCNPAMIKKFNDNGQQVIAWGYVFDKRTATNVTGVADAVKKSIEAGCKGFVIDIEKEAENTSTHAQIEEMLKAIRAVVPAGQLGYTSFGNPEGHPNIPWKLLNDACDYCMNQFYYHLWKFDTNENEVKIAFEQHKKFGLNKPIYPIFTAENGADPIELQKFVDAYEGSAVYAAQCPPAWQIDYRGGLQQEKIVTILVNVNDSSDYRGLDVAGKTVHWFDPPASLSELYLSALKIGADKAKLVARSLDKRPVVCVQTVK